MKRFVIPILFILIGTGAYSQDLTQTVRGRVIDSQTEAPLVGAVVTIKNSNPLLGDRTDAEGNFKIEKVAAGRQTIEVSHIGYLPYSRENIFVTSNRETDLIIKLEDR